MPARIPNLIGLLATLSLGAVALAPQAAFAQSSDLQAEKFRLSEEAKRLATRNAWPGVEAKYEELLKLKVDLPFDIHILGSQSAKFLGKTYEVYKRLERAKEIDPTEDVLAEMATIDKDYGRVELVGNERWTVVLRRPSMPFNPDQRKSVEYAISVAEGAGGFKGMLPAGEYVIGPEEEEEPFTFTVEPGPEWQTIEITKDMISGSEGVIVYHGPIVAAGYNLEASTVPGSPVEASDGRHQAIPDGVLGSGVVVDAGYQLGFTRDIALAMTLQYRGTFTSTAGWHSGTGWIAGVVTPARARIALGPTYTVMTGRGSGVADWFDVNQDPLRYPTDAIAYKGRSLASGLKLTAGYGVLDFEPFQGVVQLGGEWQTDGARHFAQASIRIGITPMVPRFQD